MASAVTHLLVGGSLGAVHGAIPAVRRTRRAWALSASAAALAVLPDADVVMHGWVDYAHPFGHRGAFHSVAFYALAALLAAGWLARTVEPGSDRRRVALAGLSCFFASMLSHSVLDMLTDGGLGIALWWPLSNERLFAPWRPIPVSPLSIEAFFTARALRILEVELLFALPIAGTAFATRWALDRRT